MDKRVPWTHEELQVLIPKLEAKLKAVEDEEGGDVKPVPPLTKDECLDYFWRLMDSAAVRPLNKQEIFIHGQLLAQFEQAILAERLGKKGRYYVIPEDKIMGMLNDAQ